VKNKQKEGNKTMNELHPNKPDGSLLPSPPLNKDKKKKCLMKFQKMNWGAQRKLHGSA
jgi:hypothetical protein